MDSIRAIKAALFAAAILAGATSPAAAQVGTRHLSQPTRAYTYYSRPGATVAMHHEAVRDCMAMAMNLNVAPGAAGALGAAIAQDSARAVMASGVENCMVARGWRVMRVSDGEGATLARLNAVALTARLANWIGAETPHGELVREWANEAANGATDRYELQPLSSGNRTLSLTAAEVATVQPAALYLSRLAPNDPGVPAVTASQLEGAPPGSAIVIVRTRGLSMQNGLGFFYMRDLGPPNGTTSVGPTDLVNVFVGAFQRRDADNWRAYIIEPGRWRFAGVGGAQILSFCLSAPAMEVRAGDVIYGGTFDLDAPSIGPDLALEPVRSWLGGSPIAERIRPAEYTNGWTAPCGGHAIYGIEFPNTPFREGASTGSAAQSLGAPTP